MKISRPRSLLVILGIFIVGAYPLSVVNWQGSGQQVPSNTPPQSQINPEDTVGINQRIPSKAHTRVIPHEIDPNGGSTKTGAGKRIGESRSVVANAPNANPRNEPATSNDGDNVRELAVRVNALEVGRQDLSAWATLFVGILAMLVTANVGFSVWQVAAITRQKVKEITPEYEQRFSEFLEVSQQSINATLKQYDQRLSTLASNMDSLSTHIEENIKANADAVAEIESQANKALEHIKLTGKAIRDDLERYVAESGAPREE